MEGETRAGFVALVGRPNAGKSTLLNALVGERIAAVSAKVQTTRHRIPAFWTRGDTQIVFVDAPGLLDPAYPLQQAMSDTALAAAHGADAVYFLAADRVPAERETGLLSGLARAGRPLFLVLTKMDLVSAAEAAAREEAWQSAAPWTGCYRVSAATGEGLESLLQATRAVLPHHPFLYDPEDITELTVRFLAGEQIREACFEELSAELPYSIHVEIAEWEEPVDAGGLTRIHAVIHVERDSQKGIVIGSGGRRLKAIGTRARRAIEALLGGPVYLRLKVKTRPKWSRREADLRFFGYKR